MKVVMYCQNCGQSTQAFFVAWMSRGPHAIGKQKGVKPYTQSFFGAWMSRGEGVKPYTQSFFGAWMSRGEQENEY